MASGRAFFRYFRILIETKIATPAPMTNQKIRRNITRSALPYGVNRCP